MSCDALVSPPPPYSTELSRQPFSGQARTKELEIVLNTTQCYYGTLIQGLVKVTPRTTTFINNVRIGLVARERSGRFGTEAPLIIKTELASSWFDVGSAVSADFSYSLSFNVQFPYLNWVDGCKCGKGHEALPPSLSPHGRANAHLNCESSYAVQVDLNGRCMAVEYLEFCPPSVSECPPIDVIVRKLPLELRLGFASPGSLTAHIWPVVHWGEPELPGKILIDLFWTPKSNQVPPKVSTIDYRIFKCVRRAARTGNMTQRFLIGSGATKEPCNWNIDNTAQLAFDYGFNMTSEPLQVSYSGCLTSVYYSMELCIAKTSFITRITVGTDGLPNYMLPALATKTREREHCLVNKC